MESLEPKLPVVRSIAWLGLCVASGKDNVLLLDRRIHHPLALPLRYGEEAAAANAAGQCAGADTSMISAVGVNGLNRLLDVQARINERFNRANVGR
jgi:hypothetical protein